VEILCVFPVYLEMGDDGAFHISFEELRNNKSGF
jgi:hypothetical protein